MIATMRNPEKQNELKYLQNIKVLPLDVTKRDSIEQALEEGIKAFGKIDVVINNAGVGVYGALELTSEEDIQRIYAVNVRGIIDVIQVFTAHFRSNNGGKFINISSVMGLSAALPLGSLYNMSKFALEGLTEGLYAELKPLNINLHLVEPGGFSSDFGENTTFVDADPTGAYGGITRKVGDIMKASQKPGTLADPGAIVKVIYDIATGDRNAFRIVVGKDARQVLLLRRLVPIRTFLNLLTRRFA